MGVAPGAHARGSHGRRLWVLGDGGVMLAAAGDVVVVTGAAVVAVVLDVPPAPVPAPVPDVPPGVDAAGGAFTVNWVPVTTVTMAPSTTREGS